MKSKIYIWNVNIYMYIGNVWKVVFDQIFFVTRKHGNMLLIIVTCLASLFGKQCLAGWWKVEHKETIHISGGSWLSHMYPLFGKPEWALFNAVLPNAEKLDGRFEKQLIGELTIAPHLPVLEGNVYLLVCLITFFWVPNVSKYPCAPRK